MNQTEMKVTHKELKNLQVDLLKIDYEYQKPLSTPNVKKIMKHFDNKCVGAIHVNARSDGYFYIIDGQHRYTAMKDLGFKSIPCMVFIGLTLEEEAKMFDHFHNIKKPSTMNKSKARLVYEGEEGNIFKIKSVCDEYGIPFSLSDKEKNGIRAHTTLERVFKNAEKYGIDGQEHLDEIFYIITTSFGKKIDYFQKKMIEGFSKFLIQYHQVLDKEYLIKKLQSKSYNFIMSQAADFRPIVKTDGESVTESIKKLYNVRAGKRILI